MRPEPGQLLLDQRIAATSIEERISWMEERRRLGHVLAWQQVDEADVSDPLEQADFLLRRLYPEMPEHWFGEVLRQLRAKHDAGEWHGFERPRP